MKYCIMVYETEGEFAERSSPAANEYWAAYTAYSKALGDAGVSYGGQGLQPPAMGTTVRLKNGKRQVQDGPYADTKEQLGGFFLIDVPDLDAALAWAERCPAAPRGAVEVRPVMGMS